jgi:hypothetical protein
VTALLKKKKQDGADEPISLADRRTDADPPTAVDVSLTDPVAIETAGAPLRLAVAAAEEEETEETADGDESVDLLKMFTDTEIETEDRTMFVKMAGDVDIDDVVAELQLVAAALNLGAPGLREAA